MPTSRWTRRSLPGRPWCLPAVVLTVLALVAGCGGSSVEPTAAGSAHTATQAQGGASASTATDASAGTGTATGSTGTTGTTGTAAAGATTGDASKPAAAAHTTTTGSGQPAAGGRANAKTGAIGSTAAVEKLVATAPIFGGTAACKPATLSEVPLGNVSTFSGVLGELLAPVRPALETFIASQNACGGLNGHKIRMYFEDDQSDPATAITKVLGLIQDKKVLAFVGDIQPLSIDAVIPTINKYGIPMIGGDLVSYTWFNNQLLFPQGAPPGAVAYGYLLGATQYHHKTNVGDIWCIEVPRACEQIDRAFKELAPTVGATVKKSTQASITAPSYVQECLGFKSNGVDALALITDAATMNRLARSCDQVDYHPKVMPTPLGVGNEKQFLTGNKWLGDSYVTMNYLPWFADDTPVQRYFHAAIKKFNPGFALGGAAMTGWNSGALLVAAAAGLGANPTTADLLNGLWQFQGQKWTELGGMNGPRTFQRNGLPKVPYCLFAGISNADNTGWAKAFSTATCTSTIAPSDPQKGR
jgi:branched-chain amino acid transport system substrate-binding protein